MLVAREPGRRHGAGPPRRRPARRRARAAAEARAARAARPLRCPQGARGDRRTKVGQTIKAIDKGFGVPVPIGPLFGRDRRHAGRARRATERRLRVDWDAPAGRASPTRSPSRTRSRSRRATRARTGSVAGGLYAKHRPRHRLVAGPRSAPTGTAQGGRRPARSTRTARSPATARRPVDRRRSTGRPARRGAALTATAAAYFEWNLLWLERPQGALPARSFPLATINVNLGGKIKPDGGSSPRARPSSSHGAQAAAGASGSAARRPAAGRRRGGAQSGAPPARRRRSRGPARACSRACPTSRTARAEPAAPTPARGGRGAAPAARERASARSIPSADPAASTPRAGPQARARRRRAASGVRVDAFLADAVAVEDGRLHAQAAGWDVALRRGAPDRRRPHRARAAPPRPGRRGARRARAGGAAGGAGGGGAAARRRTRRACAARSRSGRRRPARCCDEQTVAAAINVEDAPLTAAGRHRFVIAVDGADVATAPFAVVLSAASAAGRGSASPA